MSNNDVRRIFTFVPGETPELLFVSGSDTNDTYVTEMVKNLCTDRAKALAKDGGFFVFTRTMLDRNLFRAVITAPDGTKVALMTNPLGTNELNIKVDDLATLAVSVIYNLPFSFDEMVEFYTRALASIVLDCVSESAMVARQAGAEAIANGEGPDEVQEKEPAKCQECDPAIKALCKQVRGVTIN